MAGKRKSRINTLKEKKDMKRARRRRKLLMKKKKETCDKTDVTSVESELAKYKSMSRCYWERWQWELTQRKYEMRKRISSCGREHCVSTKLHEVDLSMLQDPGSEPVFVGRGSFGVVRLQVFRDIKVAVKELLPHTLLNDVQQEVSILASLSHPLLPFLFGVHTSSKPYKIIMQFHGLNNFSTSVTLYEAISKNLFKSPSIWLILSLQILQAFTYLHEEVPVIHNDVTTENVLVTNSFTDDTVVQIVVIDFGKASKANSGKKYNMSDTEKSSYMVKYPYLAPELIEGCVKENMA